MNRFTPHNLAIAVTIIIAVIILFSSTPSAPTPRVCCKPTSLPREAFTIPPQVPDHNKLTTPQINAKVDNEPKHELILYYATWCGYSRSFLPIWAEFEKWAADALPTVRVMSVRCEEGNEQTCRQKGVSGYPTVMLYLTNGTEHQFEGKRTLDGLQSFAKSYVH